MPALKTFLVEDSPVIQQSLVATLEELTPVKVVGMAEDEWHAMQWLSQPSNAVQLVIVDIFLKRGSGLGVLKAAQQLGPRCTLVVLSNYATSDIRARCLALGAKRVFDKSTEIDALIEYCGELAEGVDSTRPADLGV
jgi:DNA-binding NarL/FixJ family response regulator